MPAQSPFAETFERLRLARGWSPAEVARRLDVYPTEVSRWRHGRGGISIRNVRKIAELFGVDPREMEQLAGYLDSPTTDSQDSVDAATAALYDAERAAIERDLSGIPPVFHTSILNAQRAARRLAIDLANAAIQLTHGPGAISTPTDGELAPPELPPGQIERRAPRPKNEPLAPAFHPAVAY